LHTIVQAWVRGNRTNGDEPIYFLLSACSFWGLILANLALRLIPVLNRSTVFAAPLLE
jgi:hypothetical protein